jgi:hypothetical protein
MIGGIFFPESILILVNDVRFIEKMFNSVIHDPFIDLTDVREKGDRPVVGAAGFSFFLKMAQTKAILSDWGKIPSWRDLLMMIEIVTENWRENSLSKLVGMLKGPEALPEPKLEMISLTSFASHGLRVMLTGLGSPRYD